MSSPNPTCTPLTPGQIARALESLLKPLIGTYAYENGVTLPAIAVGHRGDKIEVKGLEVVIAIAPQLNTQGTTSGVHSDVYLDVRLVAADEAGEENLLPAVYSICANFIVERAIALPAGRNYDIPEQYKLTLKFYQMLFAA